MAMTLTCEKCGGLMAPAETQCSHCGAPAPAGRSALLLLNRAERAYEEGKLAEAISLIEKATQSGLPQEALAGSWRKLGLWQEKLAEGAKRPELLARAGEAFRQAIALNDGDEISHQLFIANCGRQGRLADAKQYYQGRLEKDPQDAIAQKQLSVIKVSAEFLLSPPKVSFQVGEKSFIEKLLYPSTWKVVSIGSTLVISIIMIIVCIIHGPAEVTVAAPDAASAAALATDPMAAFNLSSMIFDPYSWGLQGALSALALYFMYRSR